MLRNRNRSQRLDDRPKARLDLKVTKAGARDLHIEVCDGVGN